MAKRTGPNVGFIREEVEKMLPIWAMVDDTVEGELAIKSKGEVYLPKPDVHADASINNKLYKKYVLRAVFFPVSGHTLAGLTGQVFSKPIATDVPTSLQYLVEDVDGAGLTLEQQSKETLKAALKHGRGGLLSDFPRNDPNQVVTKADIASGKIRSRIIFYEASQVINWRLASMNGETKLSLLVLYENKIIDDDGFEYETEPRWRVYQLKEGAVTVTVYKLEDGNDGDAAEYVVDEQETIVTGGNQQPLTEIPFSFVGAENNDAQVDDSPLYPISQLNIAHYRNSAEYEESAFNVGQPTVVFSGLTDDWVTKHINGKVTIGSVTPISLPANSSADMMQPDPNTMAKEGMTHKEDQMKAIGAKLIEPGTVQRTATEAEIEETSEASVLSSVAKNVSAAYELAFYYCSLFTDPVEKDQITIELNSEFQVAGLNFQERQEVVGAWGAGMIAWEEAREVYRRKGIATLSDDEAQEKIRTEQANFGGNEPVEPAIEE